MALKLWVMSNIKPANGRPIFYTKNQWIENQ